MNRLLITLLSIVFATLVFSGCHSPPEPPPEPVPAPTPQPEPEPEDPHPEPVEEPRPPAPLEGPRWTLVSLYGSSRMTPPPDGSVWVEFDDTDELPVFRAYTAVELITGEYATGPGGGLSVHPGITSSGLDDDPRFATYRRQFLENISLIQGYYIQGDTRPESRLVVFGGVGLEEIILAEFVIDE